MKKLFLIGALIGAVTTSSFAQVAFRSFPMIMGDLASITMTNTVGLTNLAASGITATTNFAVTTFGLVITNQYGVQTRILGPSTFNTKNLLKDAPLWAQRSGEPPFFNAATNNSSTADQRASYVGLTVKAISGSGLDQAVTLVFAPIVNGKDEATGAEAWAVAFTPTVSSTQVLVTNVPVWRWPWASGLRLKSVSYTDTTAASTWTLLDISINGYVPQ